MMKLIEQLFRSHDLDRQEFGPAVEEVYYTRGSPTAAEEYVANDCTRCPGCGEGLLKEEPQSEESSGDSTMSRYGFCSTCGTIVIETLLVTHAEVIFPEERSQYL